MNSLSANLVSAILGPQQPASYWFNHVTGLSLVLALLLTGCAANLPAPTKPSAAEPEMQFAARFFSQNCAICHGPRGEGKQLGEITVPNLRLGSAWRYTDEQIAQGKNKMPPFKRMLNQEQINIMVRYIRAELQDGR